MNGQQLKSLLASDRKPATRSADEFWGEFRARGALCTRDEGAGVEALRLPGARRVSIWWSAPAAALAALLALVLRVGPAEPSSAAGAIQSYDIGADVVHGGVMILNDEPSHATILWIADLSDSA